MSSNSLVTVDFLGIRLDVRFRKTKYDYVSKLDEQTACECYERALARLNRSSFDKGYRLEVCVGVTNLGLVRSVTLFRYVQDVKTELVQYVMSLRMSSKGNELSVSQTVYNFFVELPESDNLYLFGE
jgi:putative lipoic acid-binding regulatory protein